ncbi:lipopolysaccharide assembly protein LapB [Aestuariibacter sp. A3R04]|uniref:tetratricopeptide repeat protein n=1 Tax=Aestuariibacter sp. A3R04 TaxID=2841571 RepID=UPI001C09741C|nr:tetratricopeptide repeat protein [Aestuariibacter sp. A3R04]MBU3022277.1 tetratricopeptide repeat protein [Aestuariibacter sp. A3R04]
MKLRTFKMSAVALVMGFGAVVAAPMAAAQTKSAAPSGPVVCPGYVKGKTTLVGERTGKKVQQAFEAYNEDRVDEAIAILKDVDPSDDFDKAYVNRFVGNLIASQEGKGMEAFGYLEKSVNPKVLNDTEHSQTLKLLGDLSMQEQKYTEAVNYYDKWMDFTCKEDAQVYTRKAQALYEQKKFDEVVPTADKAIALNKQAGKPDKNPYLLKLSAFYESKKFPQTVSVAEELVNLFPDNATYWIQLASFYMLVERFDKAVQTFDIAYMAGFLDKDSHIKQLASLYANAGNPHKAAKVLEKYLNSGLLKKDAEMYASVANSFHQAKDYKDAAKFYGKAAQVDSDPEYYRKQGTLLLVAEDYRGAITALNKALERGVEDEAKIHFSLMEANFYLGNYKKAFEHVQIAKKDKSLRRNAIAWEPYIKDKAKNRGIKI